MKHSLAVIGVGNMAKAILNGIFATNNDCVSHVFLYDKQEEQAKNFASLSNVTICSSIQEAAASADLVLLAVKPQNYSEVLKEITCVPHHTEKLYISIAAGITVETVTKALNGAKTVRILPNVPMVIGYGASLVCKNDLVSSEWFEDVCSLFRSSGSVMLIDEAEMNRLIGVTSSSPAYVFRFIQAILDGAEAQGLKADEQMLSTVCDVVIGSAQLLKQSGKTPDALVSQVASKGGTTEKALEQLELGGLSETIAKAMSACTKRADELGA